MMRHFCKAYDTPVQELMVSIHHWPWWKLKYITEKDSAPRVRRLHLIIVDMHRRKPMAHRVLKLLIDLQIESV